MDLGAGGGKHTALATESLVPALLIEMDIHGVNFIEEARVPDVELVGCHTDYGA